MQEQGGGQPGLIEEWTHRARRRIRQWQGNEPRTEEQLRCERVRHAGWWICPLVLRPGDIVYSIDRGTDLRFENTLLKDYEGRVYIFDPDPDTAARADQDGLLEIFQLYAIRVGPKNQAADPDRGPDGARMIRLPELMRMLGHRRLDLLKIDVDTAPGIVRDVVAEEIDVGQLLVRFGRPETEADRERVEGLVGALNSRGYRIFRISGDGSRYSFLRTDIAPV